MASSQVGIASTSPFNRREAWRDHISSSNLSSVSPDSAPNQNAQKPISNGKKHLGSLSFTRRIHNIFREKDDSSLSALVSPRHKCIIDRWAAKQAQEAATTANRHDEVEVFDDFPHRREGSVSPPRSDGSTKSEVSSLGASSLVQIWEKRLNKSKPCTPVASPGRITSPDIGGLCNENASCSVEEQCRVSEEGDSSDEPQCNEESSPNWESEKTSLNDQSCSLKVQSLDAAERERGRVANIIKRLAVTNQMQSPVSLIGNDNDNNEPCSASTPRLKQSEHRVFAQVISSPRIRGRQAFNDLIMQFENERHGELNNLAERGAVTKFTQRGRIQSVLRLRLLQRGVAVFEQSPKKSAASEVNRQQQGSVIMQLREKFNTGDEHRTSALAEVSDSRSPSGEIVSNTPQLDNFPTSNQISKGSSSKTVSSTGIHCKEPTHNLISQTSADNKEEAHPSFDVTFQRTLFEARNDDAKETTEASSSIAHSNANEVADKVEASYQQQHATAEPSYDEIIEEEEASDQNYDEARYDWISQISRPRSYWEELRHAWYQKMLDFGSHNDDRRNLLERRTVSTVLSCDDFRKRMDRMMKSHMGTQTDLVNSQYDMEDEGNMEQLMAFFHDRLRFRGSPQEDGRDGREEEEVTGRNNEVEVEEDEEEEEKSTICSGSDHELGDYFNQTPLSMNTPSSSTWSYRDPDAGDDSDRVASVSSPLPSQQYSSSANHHSIEMEYIYDMRGQMVQLFHEMSELRKSIKSCMDMQMQLQQSKYQKVHPVKEEEEEEEEEEAKESLNRTPKKGICGICYENKVNSVLYRCGHMCACFKCANQLQSNNGKCPICQAKIIDVIRVHTNSELFMVDNA